MTPARSPRHDELSVLLEQALGCGRYLFVLWRRTPEGRLIMDRGTLDFPKDDFPEAVRMLRDDLGKEIRELAVRTMQTQTRTVEVAANDGNRGPDAALQAPPHPDDQNDRRSTGGD